jgi:hypothetical protein
MAASISELRRRADRLMAEVEEHRSRTTLFTSAVNTTQLPSVDRWPEFARKTWIRTAGTITTFDPYDFQIDLVERINAARNVIVDKSRQTGASETVASYLACRASTEPGFAGVIISKTQNDSSDLGRRTRRMLNSIQGHTFKYTSDSNTLVSIVGGGTLYFLPGGARAARGIPSGSVLWIDEAAFVEDVDEIYRAAAPALSMLGDAAKVIVTSTPDTETGWFGSLWNDGAPDDWYDLVVQAIASPERGPALMAELNALLSRANDDWTRIAIHWSQHPIYGADPGWAEKTRESRRMTAAAWASEYELAFGATDTQVYPTALIREATCGHWRECGVIGRTYVLGIDPNGGGNDYFVAMVLDITQRPYEVVAMYRQNGRSTEYSLRHVVGLIEDFMPERVVIEKQAMGVVIGEALQGALPSYAIELFNTSRPSKLTATDRVLYFLEHKALIFPEGVIPQELRAFHHYESGERKAAPGYHDDTVMGLALACSLIPDTPPTAAFFQNL